MYKYNGERLTGKDIGDPLLGDITYKLWWDLGSGDNGAVAKARGGNISTGPATILLGASFFDPPKGALGDYIFGSVTFDRGSFASVREFQSQILVHEFMHLYTGKGDHQLAIALGSKGARLSVDLMSSKHYSEAIALWQSQGCPRKGRGD